jgi:hypothetical protein
MTRGRYHADLLKTAAAKQPYRLCSFAFFFFLISSTEIEKKKKNHTAAHNSIRPGAVTTAAPKQTLYTLIPASGGPAQIVIKSESPSPSYLQPQPVRSTSQALRL